MEFKKYQHIVRLNDTNAEGIDVGECYIFPKIDGTNSQVWLDDDGNLCAGSRNRKLTIESDKATIIITNTGFGIRIKSPQNKNLTGYPVRSILSYSVLNVNECLFIQELFTRRKLHADAEYIHCGLKLIVRRERRCDADV